MKIIAIIRQIFGSTIESRQRGRAMIEVRQAATAAMK